MPNRGFGLINSLTKKDQKVFFKILTLGANKESEIYNTIKKERDNVLKIILNFLKEEGKYQDEIKQLMEEIEDEKKEDLFYSILSGKEGNICKEIYENIKKDKNYSNFDIINAFKKINDKDKKEEQEKKEKKTEGEEKEEKKKEREEKEEKKTEGEEKEGKKTEGEKKEDKITEGEEKKDKITEGEEKKDKITEGEEKEDRITEGEEKEDKITEGEKKEDKITEGEKKEEKKTVEPIMPLLQDYYIKLWCFNFISFNYPCNDEYLKKIKEEIRNNGELKKKFSSNEEKIEYELIGLKKEKIILLEEGKTLKSIQKAAEDKDDLSKLRKGDKKKFQKLIQHIIKQLSIGLYLFHHLSKSESLYHNDLKPDNALIIIDEKETDLYKKYMSATIKVVDLDLTRKINIEELNNKDFYTKMYKEDLFPYDDPDKEEIYELGEIMFELLTGEMFNRGNQKEINVKNKVMEKNCIIRADYELCESTIQFLHSTLKTNRAYRISCDEAFEHPFFKEEQFEKVNFDKLPNELTSSDKSRFYLPIYRKYLILKNYEMEIEDGNKCLVEEF